MKVPDLRKKSYAEVAKLYGQNRSSIHEIVKKEKEICASFAVPPQTAKATATVHGKCLVKVEKALHLYNKVLREREGRRERPHLHTFYYSILL